MRPRFVAPEHGASGTATRGGAVLEKTHRQQVPAAPSRKLGLAGTDCEEEQLNAFYSRMTHLCGERF